MLEKFVQAAIITFLLHLVVVLSPNTNLETQAEKGLSIAPLPIAVALP